MSLWIKSRPDVSIPRFLLYPRFSEMAGVMSKDDIAKSAEKGRWKDVSMQRKGMAQLSDTSAVITYECEATRKNGQPYHAVVSSGYVSRPDGWKLAFHQQTALAK